MALCIRNPVAEKLARTLARQTGKRITQTIVTALEHELQRSKGRPPTPRLEDGLLAISRRCAALPDVDSRSPEAILGYDGHGGLPGW
jgi:antitoxin VapB